MEDILIMNGKVVAESRFLPSGYVTVTDGKISSIGEDCRGIEAKRTIDAKGLYVSPGFIDMHTHGIKDVDFMEADPQAMVRGLREYAAFGVTRVVATTLLNTLDTIIAQVRRIGEAMEDPELGGMLLGAHVEGPWLAPRCRGGHALEYLRAPEKADVDRLLAASCRCSATRRGASRTPSGRSLPAPGTRPTCTTRSSGTGRTRRRRSS